MRILLARILARLSSLQVASFDVKGNRCLTYTTQRFGECFVVLLTLTTLLVPDLLSAADDSEVCIYTNAAGSIVQTNSRKDVPSQFRNTSKCFTPKNANTMVAPAEVKLEGSVRHEDIVSALGPIKLRWARSVEGMFGRTPQRAMREAAQAIGRVLKQSGVPSEFSNMRLDWDVVFMDEEVPDTQIPLQLVTNCHPAWMVPTASVYVVAQRVLAGCMGAQARQSRIGDEQLIDVLLHEMGHAIEFQLLGRRQNNDQAMAEGFATWFAEYASRYSDVARGSGIYSLYKRAARERFGQSGLGFDGTMAAYALAAAPYHAITARKGLSGVMKVYTEMREKDLPFDAAVDSAIGWNAKRMAIEVQSYLK